MNVVIISNSDNRGGAAVVSVRLLQSLNSIGVNTRMLVVHNELDNPCIQSLRPAWKCKLEFLTEHIEIYANNGFSRKNLFKISTGRWGMPIHRHPWVKDADIVLLEWVNQGTVSLNDIKKIKAQVVWAMHDMWNMTGICHHAGKCENYLEECGNCHLMRWPRKHDLSWHIWKDKKTLYQQKNINFVAVSTWLARKAQASSLLRTENIHIIPNPFLLDQFGLYPKKKKAYYGIPEGKKIVILGAARLDDPIKGLEIAVNALNRLNQEDLFVVFFGDLNNKSALNDLKIPYIWMNKINDSSIIRDLYAHADVVFSSSHYETLPTTLIEGMASGCMPVAFNQGGQTDIIDHLKTGYLANYPDIDDLAEGIKWAINNNCTPTTLRIEIEKKFNSDTIAKRYVKLFENLLTKQI